MATAFFLRYVLNIGVVDGGSRPELTAYLLHYSAGFALFILLAENLSLYDSKVALSVEKSTARLLKIALYWAVMFLGSSLILKLNPPISRLFVGYSCALMCLILPFWRLSYLRFWSKVGFGKGLTRRVLIVGGSVNNRKLAEKMSANPEDPYEIVGVVASRYASKSERGGLPLLGSLDDLEEVFLNYDIDVVAVADSDISRGEILKIATLSERHFVEFNLIPDHFEVFTRCLGLKLIGNQHVMGVAELPQNQIFSRMVKRIVDIIGALFGLLISLPIFPVVAFLIWKESPGPILYRQVRTGKGGASFTIYKFRSMKLASEADGKARWCRPDDDRRLKIGAFMRKWNIDEIPQFWNVLKGDMSLVGPRPERPELIVDFLDEIPHYQSRHSVRPGMSGWAQVNGLRGNTSLEDRIRYDLDYIENWSLWLDLVIKFRTFIHFNNAY
ncbi:exopolysaccharide biosynthesis polyprenyl glycosylphosphotransferase subfamily [Verrucomicrobiia bacterium DG1235]|nr:exopolysaccharide biosynthesis polyprenyl glycosylphosphotransferase subfamily [Verrucomicrobiae bacterium DG1235]